MTKKERLSCEQSVSCLMVTSLSAKRFPRVKKSILSFTHQTYPNKELLIIIDSPSYFEEVQLIHFIRQLRSINPIRILKPSGKHALGTLRNMAMTKAKGDFLCQWDDDDLYHPTRIEYQLDALLKSNAGAVVLQNFLHYFEKTQICFWADWSRVPYKALPGTILVRKSECIPYKRAKKGEDQSFLSRLQLRTKVLALDNKPFLYIYVYHGSNTWNFNHHLRLAKAASVSEKMLCTHLKSIISGMGESGLPTRGITFVNESSEELG